MSLLDRYHEFEKYYKKPVDAKVTLVGILLTILWLGVGTIGFFACLMKGICEGCIPEQSDATDYYSSDNSSMIIDTSSTSYEAEQPPFAFYLSFITMLTSLIPMAFISIYSTVRQKSFGHPHQGIDDARVFSDHSDVFNGDLEEENDIGNLGDIVDANLLLQYNSEEEGDPFVRPDPEGTNAVVVVEGSQTQKRGHNIKRLG